MSRYIFIVTMDYVDKSDVEVFNHEAYTGEKKVFHSKLSNFQQYQSSASFRNLGVIFDDQLTFKEHIAKTGRSCRFALHNIGKIRPFLTEHAAQLLVQALVISRLDYCNALLAGLPESTIKPLQMIQIAAARLVCVANGDKTLCWLND